LTFTFYALRFTQEITMAVFTDITHPLYHEQLLELQKAYCLSIRSIEGLVPGSNDSKFKMTVNEYEEPLVMTIHETPRVTPAGNSREETILFLRYIDYLAGAVAGTVDKHGKPVNINVLRPLRAYPQSEHEAPFLDLTFDGEKKPVSIVPFIYGKEFENAPEELVDLDEIWLAGRALAAYSTVARSYPESHLFKKFDIETCVQEIRRISVNTEVAERLGNILSGRGFREDKVQELGLAYLDEMNESGQKLLTNWREIEGSGSDFFQSLIHGDLFTDNTMIGHDGRFFLLDFSDVCYGSIGIDIGISLNSWTSHNGRPQKEHISTFLEAFDSVIPLTGTALSTIPTYAQIGAFRWETFRIQRIEMQDPAKYIMRSPEEFQSLRHAWNEMSDLFEGLSSVQELASRIE
jgi:hypothetical protein